MDTATLPPMPFILAPSRPAHPRLGRDAGEVGTRFCAVLMLAMLTVLALPLGQHLRVSLPTAPAPSAWAGQRSQPAAALASDASPVSTLAGLPHVQYRGDQAHRAAAVPRLAPHRFLARRDVTTGAPLSLARTQRLAALAAPGMVNLTTVLPDGSGKAGTGIVLDTAGEVLTNCHVVDGYGHWPDGGDSVRGVDLGDGHTYPVRVLGCDRRHDIAVVRLLGARGLAVARIGDDHRLRPGETLASVGNAWGLGRVAIGTGPLTGTGRAITSTTGQTHPLTGLLEVRDGIVPGQSGGPLLDTRGRVVGVNTARALAADGTPTGIGYAISISHALHAAHALLRHAAHETDSTTHSRLPLAAASSANR